MVDFCVKFLQIVLHFYMIIRVPAFILCLNVLQGV